MNPLTINNIKQIHWACRRGMRELDILIMPFFEKHYIYLSDEEKQSFISLLNEDDPTLFRWLMRQEAPADHQLQHIILLIQESQINNVAN